MAEKAPSLSPGAAPRIGLFGGSFNPPHLAHLALARLAREHLGLDVLRWFPAKAPWQKAGETMALPAQRLAMVHLLLQGEPGMLVDEAEMQRPGPTYTIDTVRQCRARWPQAQLFLVIGQDQYARFHTWHRHLDILAEVTLAVAARAGQAVQPSAELAAVPHRIQVLPLPELPISGTQVRTLAAQGQDVTALVGEKVAGYISEHYLYQGLDGHP